LGTLKAFYNWCERWLEDPQHDALRARGNRRWHLISGLQQHLAALYDFWSWEKRDGTTPDS